MEDQRTVSAPPQPAPSVSIPPPSLPEPERRWNSWKIPGLVVAGIVVFFLFFMADSLYLNQHDGVPKEKECGAGPCPASTTPVAATMLKSNKITFSPASYKNFALTDTVDSLDPKINTPNLTEYGMPHIEIVQKGDGYATVRLNLLAATMNVPLGWESMGGFDPFDKIFFYPKGTFPKDEGLPTTYIALKILDSSSIGDSFDAVQKKVDDLMRGFEAKDSAYKNRVSYVDPANKTFAFEVRGLVHAVTKKPHAVLDIYMQDPNPGALLWANLQLSVPDDQYEKYKGLDGLMYRDLQINWANLEQLASQSGQ